MSLGRVIRVDAAEPPLGCDLHGHCITCGDEAVAMRVRRIDAERALALCEDAEGRRASVEIALVEPVAVDDRLLVHAGTAIGRASAGDVGHGREPSRSGGASGATRRRGEPG